MRPDAKLFRRPIRTGPAPPIESTMQRILNDARFGARMLVKARSSTALVLVALSLGIGLSAVMFSMIDGAVLASLPVVVVVAASSLADALSGM